MNDIKILGRLTDTPEIKRSANGRDYAWFTVAVPRRNNKDEADFIRCVAFDKLAAAICQHCQKGRQVLATGRLQVSTSIDDDTKRIRYHHTVVVASTHFLHDPNRASAMDPAMAAQSFITRMAVNGTGARKACEDKELTASISL